MRNSQLPRSRPGSRRIDRRRHRQAPCYALGVHPKAHAKQRAGATMVVACRRSLAASNHVPESPLPHRLPPHRGEGRLVASGRQRRRARCTRTGSRRWPRTSPRLHRDKRDVLVVSSGAIALGRAVLKLPPGPLKLEDSQAAAAVGQIALARTWSEVLGRHRHHRRPGSRHAAGHRGAPALSQCALHHRQAAGVALGARDQRERHGRDQRNPLRRQRPARRARRHHGERGPAGAALRHRRALRRAACRQCRRPS